MIGFLQGQVQHLFTPNAIIMTQNGVGYEVELPLNAFCQLQLNQQIGLWTHFLVREDAQLLFGFLTYQDRELFRQLLKVNGVGAKMALAIMSTLLLDELNHYINTNNETALTRIPGVGKKTAQRLIIELSDKLKQLSTSTTPQLNANFDMINQTNANANNEMHIITEVEAGLIALGYKEKEAQSAIKFAKAQISEPITTQLLLKLALKSLA